MLFERIEASGIGLTIGSIGGSQNNNITFRDCHMHNSSGGHDLAHNGGPRIKGRRQGNATISGDHHHSQTTGLARPEFPTPWRCSDIHFEDIVLDGVGVGISVDMTYETPGSTHENIGCTAKGVTYVASCLTTPIICCMLEPTHYMLNLCSGSQT